MKNYLSDRTHRTKINDSCFSCLDLLIEVPQGSTQGPLSIYICNLFFFIEKDRIL